MKWSLIQKFKMKHKHIVIFFFIITFLVGVITYVGVNTNSVNSNNENSVNNESGSNLDDDIILTVNGYPIYLDEFSRFMNKERAAVFREVGVEYMDENFWDQNYNGTTPRKILLEKTVKKMVREKTEQLFFKQLGLVDDVSYKAFLEHLEQLNRQRQKAVDAGQVIYGPIQYSARQYYSHWMATTQIKAQDQIGQLEIEESQLRDYYERTKHRYKTVSAWTLEILEVEGSPDQDGGVKVVAEEIELKVRKEGAMEAISMDYKDSKKVQVSFQQVEKMDQDRIGEWFMKDDLSLTLGGVLQVPMSNKEIWIVKAMEFFAPDYLPFEQIRNRLRPNFEDEAYNKMIQKRVKDARVEINHKIMNEIEMM